MKRILLNTIKRNSPDYKKYYALVDDEDYGRVSQYNWHVWESKQGTLYAITNIKVKLRYKSLKMHKFLTGFKQTDHINGDGLDNQKGNLREANSSQNNWNKDVNKNNTSGLKGVYWNKQRSNWKAQIGYKGQRINLGVYKDKVVAGIIYDINAIALHGEFAKTNFGNPAVSQAGKIQAVA